MIRLDTANFLGVAGVSKYETVLAKRLGGWFEWPMVILAIWVPVQWYFATINTLPMRYTAVMDWVVWGFFVVETSLLSLVVTDKKRYLASNWINPLIIVFGCPMLWKAHLLIGSFRSLRLLVLFGILMKLTRAGHRVLRRNQLGTTLLVSAVVIIFAGVLISIVDPAFNTPWEGIWWAWVTVTTVGYGDFVPVSVMGRVFGGLLILLGVCLFALLTANFSAALIGEEVSSGRKERSDVGNGDENVLNKLIEIEERLGRIEKKLEGIKK